MIIPDDRLRLSIYDRAWPANDQNFVVFTSATILVPKQ